MKINRFHLSTLSAAIMLGLSPATFAEEAATEGAQEGDEIVRIIGSRSQKPRTASDTTVPVDILDESDLTALGSTADLTDNLKALIPSYTATPATGDGSAFVRPTSLRGTASDQTLVLVNGKRRHRSALVQFFAPAAGNGAHGVDIGMIPSNAVKRVEVLRDGASSQYGSDAIAGVINFVLKDAADGGNFAVQYGQFKEGETSTKIQFNKGLALGDNGFINVSFENTDNEALSRSVLRPDAQAIIASGVTGVGADSPFGDAPLTQTWGRPETSGNRLFINSGVDLSESAKLYARLGYADTDGRYRFFYRNPNHSTLTTLRGLGYSGNLNDVGFTPFLDGAQTDTSFVVGMNGEFENGTYYDYSFSYGVNELDYFLNNTINASLGLTSGGEIPQMDFDVGGYEQSEVNLNADFSKLLSDDLNMAYGFEWREETYTVIAGEPSASVGGGSSGFKGITEQDAGEYSRDNLAAYVDFEHDVSYDLLMQYALRFEDFSDFGSTLNGKVAMRYNLSDDTALRGAISTGFHAPTPGQANVRTTITTFDGQTGLQVEEGLVPSTDPRVLAVGGKELTEEQSTNLSIGLTTNFSEDTTLTVDVYSIAVDGRIYRTGDITVPNEPGTISFYTNALDVEHTGLDLVYSSNFEWSNDLATSLSLAYSYNEIDVVSQAQVNGVNPVSDALVEDIENNYPNHRWVATTNTPMGDDMNLMVRVNYYGEHYDERGRIGADSSPSALIDPVVYVDAEFTYNLTPEFKLILGVNNMFDQYPDQIGPPNANRLSVGLQYPRRSAANYEGMSWYLGGSYSFD
jgi:iron complex outermembrane receptor protein